jgi:hypothetical protein
LLEAILIDDVVDPHIELSPTIRLDYDEDLLADCVRQAGSCGRRAGPLPQGSDMRQKPTVILCRGMLLIPIREVVAIMA